MSSVNAKLCPNGNKKNEAKWQKQKIKQSEWQNVLLHVASVVCWDKTSDEHGRDKTSGCRWLRHGVSLDKQTPWKMF